MCCGELTNIENVPCKRPDPVINNKTITEIEGLIKSIRDYEYILNRLKDRLTVVTKECKYELED